MLLTVSRMYCASVRDVEGYNVAQMNVRGGRRGIGKHLTTVVAFLRR